jgi:glycosyltransferase involved in cell wall biosynthesis
MSTATTVGVETALIICDSYPPDVGGMASTTFRLSNYLSANGRPAVVLTLNRDFIKTFWGAEQIYKNRTEDYITIFNRHGEFKENWDKLLPVNVKPKVILAVYMGSSAHWAAQLSARMNIPLYILCIGSDINCNFDKLCRKWKYKKLLKAAKRVGILSEEMKEKFNLFPRYLRKIILLPPGVNHDHFVPKKETIKYDFLFVGRARQIKGLDRFINAVSKIKKPLQVCIISPFVEADSGYLEFCKKLSSNLAGHHHILWLSDQTQEEMLGHYNSSRFVVVPSRSEGAPHVVLEAMACERPVIAADVGRVKEMIGSKGFVFKSDDKLFSLIQKGAQNKLKIPPGLRERVLKVASNSLERYAYRKFTKIDKLVRSTV